MEEEYFKGIAIVRQFLDDIELLSDKKYDEIDFDFYEKKFEKLLFYISRSFLSSNFDELFYNLDDEVPKTIFNQTGFLNPKVKNYSALTKYLFEHQYCKMPERLLQDPILAYKVIRNMLCHYEYKIVGDKIIFEKVDFDKNAEISVASMVKLLQETLTSYGKSTKAGAYDYWPVLSSTEGKSCMFLIKNLEDNIAPPSSVITHLSYELKKNELKTIPSTNSFYIFLKEMANHLGRYYIKKVCFNQETMEIAGISKISNHDDLDLYMCAYDRIKRTGIMYNMLVDILFSLHNQSTNHLHDEYNRFYSILSNTVFISYVSLIFDDSLAKNFNGIVDSNLFTKKTAVQDKDIPRKFRNSLAHSRYCFKNIFDSSGKTMILFWDEESGERNFKCEITKKNLLKFIRDCLAQYSPMSEQGNH